MDAEPLSEDELDARLRAGDPPGHGRCADKATTGLEPV